MKRTYQAFPVKKLPAELRHGLVAEGVVAITIEAAEADGPRLDNGLDDGLDHGLDPGDLAASETLAEQEKRVEDLCARRKFW